MGSQTVMDLIGSALIFGWMLLMTIRTDVGNNENMRNLKGDLLVQQNLVEVTKLLEYDFRKIGFCNEPNNLPDPTRAILAADSNAVKFLEDVDLDGSGPDGMIDSVSYYLGPASELANTPNPRDRMLYRVVDSQPAKGANLGITTFLLAYFDQFGNKINTPVPPSDLQKIQSIQITISVENVYNDTVVETAPLNTQYSSAFWQQMRLSSRNYRNR